MRGELCRPAAGSPARDVPTKRWHQLIADIGEFVAAGGAEKAAILGYVEKEFAGSAIFDLLERGWGWWMRGDEQGKIAGGNTSRVYDFDVARLTFPA